MEWKKLHLSLANDSQLVTFIIAAFAVLFLLSLLSLLFLGLWPCALLLGVLALIIACGIRKFSQNRSYLLNRIKVSRRLDKKQMEKNGFESILYMAFELPSEEDRFLDDKIKRMALYRLVSIMQKPAKEIVNDYFITITTESCFEMGCRVWTKKRAKTASVRRKKVPLAPAPLAKA